MGKIYQAVKFFTNPQKAISNLHSQKKYHLRTPIRIFKTQTVILNIFMVKIKQGND